MKTTTISEMERTASLLSLEERTEEKLLRQSEEMNRFPSHPLHFKFEAPTKNRLKRQSPNHLIKALQQKHKLLSLARNQPLEMLRDYEDWQAETPTIILDIAGIQTKEHHTDKELSSLTLVVAYPSTTWARAYKDGSAEEAAKTAEVEFSLSSPMAAPSRSLWLQDSGKQITQLKSVPCPWQPRP